MHRWPWSTHQVDGDAPHHLARYSTGSFTTVQSWDQAGSICALSRSRSQEKGRIEASDRRAAAAREPYPRRTCPPPRSAKAGILTSRDLSFRAKKKMALKAESSADTTQPLGAPRSAMRASLRGAKNELRPIHMTPTLGLHAAHRAGPIPRGAGERREFRGQPRYWGGWKQRTPSASLVRSSGRSSLEVAGRPCSATKRSRWPCPLRSAAPSHARPMVPAQAVNGWRDDGQLGPGLLNHPGERAPSQKPQSPGLPSPSCL